LTAGQTPRHAASSGRLSIKNISHRIIPVNWALKLEVTAFECDPMNSQAVLV